MSEGVKSTRIESVDIFRGMTMAAMVVVNNSGFKKHSFSQLQHAKWDGLTFTDFIFPFFLFLVGFSIILSFSRAREKGVGKKVLLKKATGRFFKLYLIGVALNIYWKKPKAFAMIRWMGVLQRIALVYIVCSVLALFLKKRGWLILSAVILVVYWIWMVYIPVPGVGTATLAVGENWAAYIDRFIVPGKLHSGTWDPEGLFTTIPAVVSGLFGMLSATWFLEDQKKSVLERQMIYGFLFLVLGIIVSFFFPINKPLWSSSYVLVTSGVAMLVLATITYFTEKDFYKKLFYPFKVIGLNAIFCYILSSIIPGLIKKSYGGFSLTESFYSVVESFPLVVINLFSLLISIGFLLIVYLFAWILYKKKIFLKL